MFHGVKLEESKLGQKLLVDVDAWMDLPPAGKFNHLPGTISYTEICCIVREAFEGAPQNLPESGSAHSICYADQVSQDICSESEFCKPHVAVHGLFCTMFWLYCSILILIL